MLPAQASLDDLLRRMGQDVPGFASKMRELIKLMDTIGVTDEVVPINLGVPGSSDDVTGWQTALDLNLTQDANFTFVDGANTWHGLTWTGVNISAGANSLAVVNGTGLVIDCNSTNTAWYYSVDSAPKIYISLLTLIPEFVWGSSELRVTCQFDTAGTNSFDLGGVAIEKPFVAGQAWTHKLYAGYTPSYTRYGQILMEGAEGTISQPTANKVNRLHLKSLTHAVYSSRSTAAADSAPNSAALDFQDYVVSGVWTPATASTGTSVSTFTPRLADPANVRLVLAAQSGNTNNQCVATFKRLRVEYKL